MGILNIAVNTASYINFQPSNNCWQVNKTEHSITDMFIDPGSAQTGYGLIAEGTPPDWIWDQTLGQPGLKPSDKHRRGFRIRVYIPNFGWAEWTSVSSGVLIGFDAIFEKIWVEKDQHESELAHIRYVGSKQIRIGRGNTRQPEFDFITWLPKFLFEDDQVYSASNTSSQMVPVIDNIKKIGIPVNDLPFKS